MPLKSATKVHQSSELKRMTTQVTQFWRCVCIIVSLENMIHFHVQLHYFKFWLLTDSYNASYLIMTWTKSNLNIDQCGYTKGKC